jgi:hypothetical protein
MLGTIGLPDLAGWLVPRVRRRSRTGLIGRRRVTSAHSDGRATIGDESPGRPFRQAATLWRASHESGLNSYRDHSV